MIDTRKLTADALQAALGDFCCAKMLRAWRNRSPVTQSYWAARAGALLPAASLPDRWRLAAALYVACGELCNPPGWTFAPAAWQPACWRNLAARLSGFITYLPEKALQRGEYDARRQAIGSKP